MAFLYLTSRSTTFFLYVYFVLGQLVKLYMSLLFYSLPQLFPALFTWQTLSLCFTLFFRCDLLKLFPGYPKQSEAVLFLSVSGPFSQCFSVASSGCWCLVLLNYHFTCLTFILTVCKDHTLLMFTSLASKRMGCSKYVYIYNLAELKSTTTYSGPTHTPSFLPVEWSFPWRPSLVSLFTFFQVPATLW